MQKINKTKIVTCVDCSRFCLNQNQKKLEDLLKKFKAEDYDEIIFCCEIFQGLIDSVCFKTQLKVGVKNKDGEIQYFNN